MYDIAIIGLGPAGSTLARLLGRRWKVLAVDRKDFSAAHGKCCGGLLATDAQKSLAKFGLTLPRDVLVDPQIFAVRTIDLHQSRERYYQRFYLNLDRHRFDRWLRSLIPPEHQVVERALCKNLRREGGHFAFEVVRGGVVRQARARIVIGADGGGGVVRRALFPGREMRRYVAIQEWFAQDRNAEPVYAAVFDPDVTDCYSWTMHKDGLLAIGSALPEERPGERFELLKRRLRLRGYRFGAPLRREGCFMHRPASFSDFVTGEDGAFLIGEAAGFISPSSLEGISYAMDSACLLARELRAGTVGAEARYAAATRPMRCKLMAKHAKNPFMYDPALRGLVLRSGLAAIEPV